MPGPRTGNCLGGRDRGRHSTPPRFRRFRTSHIGCQRHSVVACHTCSFLGCPDGRFSRLSGRPESVMVMRFDGIPAVGIHLLLPPKQLSVSRAYPLMPARPTTRKGSLACDSALSWRYACDGGPACPSDSRNRNRMATSVPNPPHHTRISPDTMGRCP